MTKSFKLRLSLGPYKVFVRKGNRVQYVFMPFGLDSKYYVTLHLETYQMMALHIEANQLVCIIFQGTPIFRAKRLSSNFVSNIKRI